MSRQLERARALIARPQAWLDQTGQAYALRLGGDRRSRIVLQIDEQSFQGLIHNPGLRLRPGGGWLPRLAEAATASPPPGRPGMIEGERAVIHSDGQIRPLKANLGESPILWLARRKDASGRPWLSPSEVAAGERLRHEAEQSQRGPQVTMSWQALPHRGRGNCPHADPLDRALSASSRVARALQSLSPRLRAIVEQVCIHGSSLQIAEQQLFLRRRQGKTLLKQGLKDLAEYYGIG